MITQTYDETQYQLLPKELSSEMILEANIGRETYSKLLAYAPVKVFPQTRVKLLRKRSVIIATLLVLLFAMYLDGFIWSVAFTYGPLEDRLEFAVTWPYYAVFS